ncbi:sulfur carrier protein ThiS [Agathobaculum sp.]|uniref:sulfur carrier protein ThiS n=1 Tax=Agathobaculum sp. TaxID=2048138 RepID=UPI002A824A42|nr:sulfur carrier protein ThiS [Agathobaculum sp.]MDY3619155.1 sulfur carrier protein ThiS [Agathobaculum sp.]
MKINGKTIAFSGVQTVAGLLKELGHDPQRVAVEKNGKIIPRASFADEPLAENDALEIVQFVGGG